MRILLVLLMTTMASAFSLTGCAAQQYLYPDADQYVAGDREITDTIDAIEVDYIAGDINVTSGSTDIISVQETAKETLDDSLKVHTWVEGSTLHVRYCKSGVSMKLNNLGKFGRLDKELTIIVPEGLELKTLGIDAAAGNVQCDVSKAQTCTIDTAAGDIDINMETCGTLSIDSAAGNVNTTMGQVKDVSVDVAAGDCSLSFKTEPNSTRVDNAAGDITIELPKDSNQTVEVDMGLGDFKSDIPFTNDENTYVIGNGQNTMSIDSGAGDVELIGA